MNSPSRATLEVVNQIYGIQRERERERERGWKSTQQRTLRPQHKVGVAHGLWIQAWERRRETQGVWVFIPVLVVKIEQVGGFQCPPDSDTWNFVPMDGSMANHTFSLFIWRYLLVITRKIFPNGGTIE